MECFADIGEEFLFSITAPQNLHLKNQLNFEEFSYFLLGFVHCKQPFFKCEKKNTLQHFLNH